MKQILVEATISASEYLLGLSPSAGAAGEWVSVTQAAKAFGCSGRHIRNLCAKGKLRNRRVGNLWRIHVSELSLPAQPQRSAPAPAASDSLTAGSAEPSRPAKAVKAALTREQEIAYKVLRMNLRKGRSEPRR